MDSKIPADDNNEGVIHNFSGLFRVYKDGRVERYINLPYYPPSNDPNTGVQSKDIHVNYSNVAARLYLPKLTEKPQKFPLLIYIHGGGFSIGSAFSYDHYQLSLVANTNMVTVSVDYRLAPEHPLPICFDDSWAVVTWVASHVEMPDHLILPDEGCSTNKEPWLMDHVDFSRVFLVGESAGATIVHDMVVRASAIEKPLGDNFKIIGMALVHPYFGNAPIEYFQYIFPKFRVDDPKLNPAVHPRLLSGLDCQRIMVFIAETDVVRDSGWSYYEAMKKSGWKGEVEIMETKGEGHVFHMLKPKCENAVALMKRLVHFFNGV